MEDVLMNWPSETSSLEALQPLSFSVLNDHEESINLDKLSRSEIAGKLLDHLDQQAEGQETEPFDWFANEKSIDLPIFENIPSSIPAGIHNSYQKATSQSSYYSYFDSPEYEPTFAPTNYVFAGSAVAEATQPQPMYAPPFNVSPVMSNTTTNAAVSSDAFVPPARIVASPHFVACDPKKEVLTPPESPKDEEILRMLREIEPEDWDSIVFDDDRSGNAATLPVATPTLDDGRALSESSCAADDLSDDATCSSYACSESSSDNDADYMPRRSVAAGRRASGSNGGGRATGGGGGGGGRKRASKPYSRHSTEERRLRKKEQNKNAATRYRMKKKQEVEECKNEEQRLADRNRELRSKLDDISREIKCLKSLMRDVYRKKGLIK